MADYAETRDKRGVFGKITAVVFWGWHILMLLWIGSVVAEIVGVEPGAGAGAEAAGGGIGLMGVLVFWLVGTPILLIPFLLTRGKKRWVQA